MNLEGYDEDGVIKIQDIYWAHEGTPVIDGVWWLRVVNDMAVDRFVDLQKRVRTRCIYVLLELITISHAVYCARGLPNFPSLFSREQILELMKENGTYEKRDRALILGSDRFDRDTIPIPAILGSENITIIREKDQIPPDEGFFSPYYIHETQYKRPILKEYAAPRFQSPKVQNLALMSTLPYSDMHHARGNEERE